MRCKRMLCVFAIAIGLSAFSGAALAECKQWKMDSGYLEVHQSNGFVVYLRFSLGLEQTGDGRHPFAFGDAYYTSGGRKVKGTLTGNVYPERFILTVQWENATRGVYRGKITRGGRVVDGDTWDEQNPRSKATWDAEGRLTCASR